MPEREKFEPTLDFEVADLGCGVHAITAPMKEVMYLIEGSESALLVDTGMGISSLKAVVDSLTSLPFETVNTHGHPDHAGGNSEFEPAWMNSADSEVYKFMASIEERVGDIRKIFRQPVPIFEDNLLPFSDETKALEIGQTFDLGDRTITAIGFPGHTPGSMMFYDSKSKFLFTGDSITHNETWLYLDGVSLPLEIYNQSLQNLLNQNLDVQKICPAHQPIEVTTGIFNDMASALQQILDGSLIGSPMETFAGHGLFVQIGEAKIIYNPDNLRA